LCGNILQCFEEVENLLPDGVTNGHPVRHRGVHDVDPHVVPRVERVSQSATVIHWVEGVALVADHTVKTKQKNIFTK
jgi:hypothetical protein